MLVDGQVDAAHRQATESARDQEQQSEGRNDNDCRRLFSSNGREIVLILATDMFISHDFHLSLKGAHHRLKGIPATRPQNGDHQTG